MKCLFCALSFLFVFNLVYTQEIAEFRGPGRQGVYPDTGLMKSWPETGPGMVLSLSGFGKGYSQPVVYNNTIFVSGTKDSLNLVSAFSMEGKLLWQTVYGKFWIRTYPENRCTPTVEGERLYIASGIGEVCCLHTVTGKILWKVDASTVYQGEIHKHGEAESLLLTENAVVYTTGGTENSMVALKKEDGTLIWKSKGLGGSKSYASPVLIEKAGMKIILTQTANHLIAIHAEDGQVLWNYDLMQYHTGEQGKGANTNPPLVYHNDIFITSGYDHPALMFTLAEDGRSVTLKWKNDVLDCHLGGVVLLDGTIYGSNWQNNSKGKWASVDWETGKVNWEKEWFNKGPIIAADGMLYLYEEKSGNVALVQTDKNNLKVISTFRMTGGEGPHWAHPAIYKGLLFVRHGDIMKVYDLKRRDDISTVPQNLSIRGNQFYLGDKNIPLWGVRVASASQNEGNTNQLISALDNYKSFGVNSVSVFVQGSSGGYSNPFSKDGKNVSVDHFNRLTRIIEECQKRSMVVIVGIFYQRTMESDTLGGFPDEASVYNAVETVTSRLKPYRNVILNIANEQNSSLYRSFKPFSFNDPQNIIKLCRHVKKFDPSRIVGGGGYNDSLNIIIGKSEYVDVLLFDTSSGDIKNNHHSGWHYDHFRGLGVPDKPILNVELFGAWTAQFIPPGVYTEEGKKIHTREIDEAVKRPGLFVHFHSNPWIQGPSGGYPARFDLGGSGTAGNPGIRWWFEYLEKRIEAR